MAEPQQKRDVTAQVPQPPLRRATTGDTVTVACKVPQGLMLQLYEMEEYQEQVMGGGWRTTKRAKKVGDPVRVRGPAMPVGVATFKRIVGGYALTQGVPKDFFEKWLHDNRDAAVVQNKLIFAHDSDTVGAAKELRALPSGYEPLSQKGDPRAPKPAPGLGVIEKDTDAKELADVE